jgi:hypothetical protein
MANRSNMSQDDFDRLLQWFGPDRDISAKKYLGAHERLTRLFQLRGCNGPEDLADQVMDRVAKRLDHASPYSGIPDSDRIAVLLGFGRHVLQEYWRKRELFGEEFDPDEEPLCVDETVLKETRARCLDSCLGTLPEDDRRLLLQYHEYEPHGKIEHRKAMAEERRTTLNALRLKACRLKSVVADCVKRCCQSEGMTGVQ